MSAWEMLEGLLEGQAAPEALAELARGRMRSKKPHPEALARKLARRIEKLGFQVQVQGLPPALVGSEAKLKLCKAEAKAPAATC